MPAQGRRPRRLTTIQHARKMLPTVSGLRRIPKWFKDVKTQITEYALARVVAVNRRLHGAGLEWKNLAAIAGCLLILWIVLNFFSPEISHMLGRDGSS